jgi:hypothetical protein
MERSVDVLAVHHISTKPQLTMLGPLHSKSNAFSKNNLATQMCERDEEG